MKSLVIALVALAAVACPAGAALLSNAFGSHMVLQAAPYAAVLYGWAKPNAAVTAQLDTDAVLKTTADAGTGKWSIALPPTKPSTVPHAVLVKDSNGNTATLTDVLFGDVYVCGGQSNMAMTVSDVFNAADEIALADDYPLIRVFTVGQANYSATPLNEFAAISQQWTRASSASIGGPAWGYFSATCWFFGRELYDREQIPIGLISSNWGGTYVEAWSSPDALEVCADCNYADWGAPNTPSVLWNAMIVPLLDMTVRGATWYQGEANIGNHECYRCSFPAMINDWRAKWSGGVAAKDFPFFFVQLAAYVEGEPGDDLPEGRLAQTAALDLSYVGMATAVDLGDIDSPDGDIHPRDKQDVGLRLALNAQHYVYGNVTAVYQGPTVLTVSKESDGPSASVRVTFTKASVARGVVLAAPNACPASVAASLCGYTSELQTSDGVWHEASIAADNDAQSVHITASLSKGTTVKGVRYLYADWPLCTIYNNAGLPAPPFVSYF
eukprot:TRINITY_DN17219_c0_g1_i1.p1 TRINITY_DN17219_c0_g1~~TRINITY_DN17219_c0_g1_i1.p1  ORF type:complete len:512 (-),score=138.52 TRINITY_DN17219_c0_g1_i1:49-1539(-)